MGLYPWLNYYGIQCIQYIDELVVKPAAPFKGVACTKQPTFNILY